MNTTPPRVHRITIGLMLASLPGLSGCAAEALRETPAKQTLGPRPALAESVAEESRAPAPMTRKRKTKPRTEVASGRGRRLALSRARVDSAPSMTGAPAPAELRTRTPAKHAAPTADGLSSEGGDFEGREASVNGFIETSADRLSTFAIDVDTAAYSIARRTLANNRMPTSSLVRVEEFLNYFDYDYSPPTGARELFSIQADGASSPIHPNRKILRVGIQAKEISAAQRKPLNLVFLVDTSGSMQSRDKLGLTRKALSFAVDQLDDRDQVAITTYAGGVRLVLPPTSGAEKKTIKDALARLRSGGGTAMSSGLQLAYRQAASMLGDGEISRIIVCSDGDANIGAVSPQQMLEQVGHYVEEGVFLSTIGFGQGNYKDMMMETLANKGNGNYFYIDSVRQAERVFARDFIEMVQDVAQDVKIQVEMNPQSVAAYRLVGYENRDVADRDFRNDTVDAGEIGAGHQVTALYEVILTDAPEERLATVRVRAKKPRGTRAKEVSFEVSTRLIAQAFEEAPADFRFATATMGSAELLRQSPHAEGWTFAKVVEIISGTGTDEAPDRAELLGLMQRAAALSGEGRPVAWR